MTRKTGERKMFWYVWTWSKSSSSIFSSQFLSWLKYKVPAPSVRRTCDRACSRVWPKASSFICDWDSSTLNECRWYIYCHRPAARRQLHSETSPSTSSPPAAFIAAFSVNTCSCVFFCSFVTCVTSQPRDFLCWSCRYFNDHGGEVFQWWKVPKYIYSGTSYRYDFETICFWVFLLYLTFQRQILYF